MRNRILNLNIRLFSFEQPNIFFVISRILKTKLTKERKIIDELTQYSSPPKVGDNNHIMFYFVLVLISGIALIIFVHKKTR